MYQKISEVFLIISGLMILAFSSADATPIAPTDFSPTSITLDFEELAAGTNVSNQYVELGVIFYGSPMGPADGDPILPFSGNVAITNTNLYIDGYSPEYGYYYGHEGNWRVVATAIGMGYGTNNGLIGAVFVDPLSGNLATTSNVGAYLFTHQLDNRAFLQMSAFDIYSNLLEMVQVFGGGENKFLGLGREEGIHRLEFFTGYLGSNWNSK